MRKILALLITTVVLSNVQAQDRQFVQEMEAALTIHDTASSVASELVALDRFRALTRKYDREWLPGYWTAYLCTQVARLKGRAPDFPADLDSKELILEAQEHLDHASKTKGQKTAAEQSDFHMLQGFVYGWVNRMVATTEAEKKKYRELQQAEYQAAVRENPRNPLMYVMTGIDLTGKDHGYKDVAAGIGLLDYAQQIFDRAPKRSMTTYWNKDFIGFWKSSAEKRLAEMLKQS